MDGRWKLGLAGGFFACVLGCKTTSAPQIVPAAPPPQPPGGNVTYVPEPAEEVTGKDGPLSTSTLLVYANITVEALAKDANKPAADRERMIAQSRQVFQDVLRREPKNVDALLGLGQLYQVTGEVEKMSEIQQRATSQHPNNAKVWAWVAVHQAQAKDFDSAAESYHRAAKLDPENRMYRMHLGFTLARGKRYSEAYEWLSRSMREAEARYNLAMMMMHNGDTDKAQMELRLCVRADPNMSVARDQLLALTAGKDVRMVGHTE